MRAMYGQVVEDIGAWRAGEPIRRLERLIRPAAHLAA